MVKSWSNFWRGKVDVKRHLQQDWLVHKLDEKHQGFSERLVFQVQDLVDFRVSLGF